MSLDLSPLNLLQREAVQVADGHSLIIAGPGTGKTLTLAYRIAHLISDGRTNPENILAVTFTTKAAHEMRERLMKLLPPDSSPSPHVSRLMVCTLHALGLSLLRENGKQIGLSPEFQIISASEQVELVREILSEYMPREPRTRALKWVRKISEQKNRIGDTPRDRYLQLNHAPEVLPAYQKKLSELNLIDFDDLILKPLILVQAFPEVREYYQKRFTHILVDEYQDLNTLQYLLLKQLRGPKTSVWIIGDPDQAIYAFRGAQGEHFTQFHTEHPETKIIRLEQNYRSTGTIINSALGVIANNSQRIPGNLFSSHPQGLPVFLLPAPDHRAEANWIVKEIEKLIGGLRMESSLGEPEVFGFSDIVILYRLHHLSYPFAEALQEAGIPHQIVRAATHVDSLLDHMIPFLKLVLNPHDELSFRAIMPHIDKSHDMFLSLLERYHQEIISLNLGALIKNIFQDMKIKERNVSEWLTLVEPFQEGSAAGQLPQFLEYVSLLKEGEAYNPKAEAVTLMTVHGAKGLEFPVVFMVGLESGLFPCTDIGEEPTDIEEERRLFYVGMTRARQRLYLTFAQARYLFGEHRKNPPSPFIAEIPQDMIETMSDIQKASQRNKRLKVKQRSLFS